MAKWCQNNAKRSLSITAACGHIVLTISSEHTGLTLVAKRLSPILPPLTPSASPETTRIDSAMGLLKPGRPLMAVRLFRPPHRSVSDVRLVDGRL